MHRLVAVTDQSETDNSIASGTSSWLTCECRLLLINLLLNFLVTYIVCLPECAVVSVTQFTCCVCLPDCWYSVLLWLKQRNSRKLQRRTAKVRYAQTINYRKNPYPVYVFHHIHANIHLCTCRSIHIYSKTCFNAHMVFLFTVYEIKHIVPINAEINYKRNSKSWADLVTCCYNWELSCCLCSCTVRLEMHPVQLPVSAHWHVPV